MTETDETTNLPRPGLLRGLSGKVLALTIVFVMIGEVLIFLPSIANFRIQWLKGRVAQAEIAALAAQAAPDQILSADLRSEILMGAGVLVVSLQEQGKRQLILRGEGDHMIDATYDLRAVPWTAAITDAFGAMFASGSRVISVTDTPPNMSGEVIEVALREAPLRAAMLRYGLNILLLSIVLSLIVAGLVFAALNIVLVRPMQRITRNMVAFRGNPEDLSRIIVPSSRQDEIGMAERELHQLQTGLATMLSQRSRLAALGLAASKVNHDLRNMLSSAHLISDRISTVDDPTVQRFVPKLIANLDRAIGFLSQTLTFGKAHEPPPSREILNLHEVADEVIDSVAVQASSRILLFNAVEDRLTVDADREQLYRVLTNLVRNAVQALEADTDGGGHEGRVTIRGWREGSVALIEVRDNGPGVPERVRPRLFEAFQSAARSGGTGLGLAIAAELVKAHGGTIRLATTGPDGTSFIVTLPDRAIEIRPGRRGEKRQSTGS